MPRPTCITRLLLPALLLFGTFAHGAPEVVVSLKPIHSLVAGVMAGVGEPQLLMTGGQSPHAFSLRPSDARRLNRADLIVWIGEALESPLARPLAALPTRVRVVTLMERPELEKAAVREGGAWEAHEHGEHHDEHGHHEKEHERHEEADPHLWLSPENAEAIAAIARDTLSELDPTNAERYRANAEALVERLHALDRAIRTRTESIRERPYLVFHDAYQLFERHYRLNAVGAVTVSPERMPGARRVRELRERIVELGARCVFSEPQFQPKLVHTLTEGTPARGGVLDPLGAEIPADPDAYFTLMNRLADSLVDCLSR